MIDDRTDKLGLPLPNPANSMQADCERIAAALRAIDEWVAGGGTVAEFADLGEFPPEGQPHAIYLALDTNLFYRWDGDDYAIVGSPVSTDELPEGDENLYFTIARAKAVIPNTSELPEGTNLYFTAARVKAVIPNTDALPEGGSLYFTSARAKAAIPNTDSLPEGAANQYFTDARAKQAADNPLLGASSITLARDAGGQLTGGTFVQSGKPGAFTFARDAGGRIVSAVTTFDGQTRTETPKYSVAGSLTVSGKGAPGNTIFVNFPSGETASATAGPDGSYVITNAQACPSAGQISVYQNNGVYNGWNTICIYTGSLFGVDSIISGPDGEISISGTSSPYGSVEVQFPDGVFNTIGANAAGVWMLTSMPSQPDGQIRVTDELTFDSESLQFFADWGPVPANPTISSVVRDAAGGALIGVIATVA